MFASILSHINIILERHVSNSKILKNIPHFNIYNKPENPFQTMTSQNNWLISSKLKSIYGNYIDSFGSNFFQIDSSWFNKVNHNQFCGLKYFYFVHLPTNYGACRAPFLFPCLLYHVQSCLITREWANKADRASFSNVYDP